MGGSFQGLVPGASSFTGPQPFGAFTGSFAATPFTEQFNQPNRPAWLDDRWTQKFTAPTQEEASQDPGWQFALNNGLQSIQRSAGARGTALNPGTIKGLNDYAQQSAAQQYGNVYNRRFAENQNAFGQFETEQNRGENNYNDVYNQAWNQYMGKYNINQGNNAAGLGAFNANLNAYNSNLGAFNANQSAQLGAFNANQAARTNDFNMASGAKLNDFNAGRTLRMDDFDIGRSLQNDDFSHGLSLAQLGLQGAQIGANSGANVSDYYTQQGNAQAAGTVGQSNGWNNALNTIGGSLGLASLFGRM